MTFTVTADGTPPVTTLVTAWDVTTWRSTNATFSLTATDTPAGASTGVAATFYRLGGTGAPVAYTPGTVVPVNTEGSTQVEYWSVDGGGAKETTNTGHDQDRQDQADVDHRPRCGR